ncbi:MAG: TfoX/Sxy family protein [Rhizobiales bacterium]|nr:TfoX/Sxy family protein [Hyphomicrobiales bacterium]
MAEFGTVSIRKMFGGAGVYRDSLMFALVADDVLYLKADAESRKDFDAEGLPPFVYEAAGGKRTVMSYFRAPEACLDDPGQMAEWCRKAYAAALRANKKR